MIIATWNVNSIRVRIGHVLEYLRTRAPDVLLLQEIKSEERNFPRLEFEEVGYNVEIYGQKSYNGVAIVSKHTISSVIRGLPGSKADSQARYIECNLNETKIASLYLPNGNPIGSDKFIYKLEWMAALRDYTSTMLHNGDRFILAGDWNVAPGAEDVFDPDLMSEDAVFHLDTRLLFREIEHLGLTDAFRSLNRDAQQTYTYYGYQGGAWQKKQGLRIDHIMLSPWVADRLVGVGIDSDQRSKDKPSDHVPIWCEIEE